MRLTKQLELRRRAKCVINYLMGNMIHLRLLPFKCLLITPICQKTNETADAPSEDSYAVA